MSSTHNSLPVPASTADRGEFSDHMTALSNTIFDSFFLSQSSQELQFSLLKLFAASNPSLRSITDPGHVLSGAVLAVVPRISNFLVRSVGRNHEDVDVLAKEDMVKREVERFAVKGLIEGIDIAARIDTTGGAIDQHTEDELDGIRDLVGHCMAAEDIGRLGKGRVRAGFMEGDPYHLVRSPWTSQSFHYLFIEPYRGETTTIQDAAAEGMKAFGVSFMEAYRLIDGRTDEQARREAIFDLHQTYVGICIAWHQLADKHPEVIGMIHPDHVPIFDAAMQIYELIEMHGETDESILDVLGEYAERPRDHEHYLEIARKYEAEDPDAYARALKNRELYRFIASEVFVLIQNGATS